MINISGQRKETLVQDKDEKNVFMPNEIFEDFRNSFPKGIHISFAYSYYYFITYLYRNAKYSFGKSFKKADILKFLNYSQRNQSYINDLIKRNGLLDEIGYTSNSSNYPVSCFISDEKPVFMHLDEWMEGFTELELNYLDVDTFTNFNVKVPKKAFYRSYESELDGVLDGTFYDIDKTHSMPITAFCRILDELDVTAFYVYGFLVSRSHISKNSYTATIDYIGKYLKLSRSITNRSLQGLKRLGLIGILNNGHKQPNTYSISQI